MFWLGILLRPGVVLPVIYYTIELYRKITNTEDV